MVDGRCCGEFSSDCDPKVCVLVPDIESVKHREKMYWEKSVDNGIIPPPHTELDYLFYDYLCSGGLWIQCSIQSVTTKYKFSACVSDTECPPVFTMKPVSTALLPICLSLTKIAFRRSILQWSMVQAGGWSGGGTVEIIAVFTMKLICNHHKINVMCV